MRLIAVNECAKHFCRFFFKRKSVPRAQKGWQTCAFIFASYSAPTADRRKKLQTHFVIHVLTYTKTFITVKL